MYGIIFENDTERVLKGLNLNNPVRPRAAVALAEEQVRGELLRE